MHPRIHLYPVLPNTGSLICTGFLFGYGFGLHVGLVLSLASRPAHSSVLEHDQAYGTRVLASTGKKRLHSYSILDRLQQVNRTLID